MLRVKPGAVVWFTGLPASGKTTLAHRVAARLDAPILLDSDELREALGFSHPGRDRSGFYSALAKLAALLSAQGHIVLVAATAHRRAWRDQARSAATRFVEVFVDVPAATCRARDPKGLYRLAAAGKISGLPGVDAKFERPRAPDVIARGGRDATAVEQVLGLIGAA